MSSSADLIRSAGAASKPVASVARRRLIDAPTRALHWWLALSVGLAWLSGDSERWRLVHICMGYSAAGLLAMELCWGVWTLGFKHKPARLRAAWGKLRGLGGWWQKWRAGQPDKSLGQNLLMAASVLLMPVLALLSVLTGLPTWIDMLAEAATERATELHALTSNLLLLAIGLHVGTLIAISWLRRRNLIEPMLTGQSAGTGPDLVRHNRRGLALLIGLAVLGFWALRAWLAWSAA
ncbi:MAG: cytochrome b/b6 domain-containing protein [Leptothrix sp. (in: b-proteobacteria)]